MSMAEEFFYDRPEWLILLALLGLFVLAAELGYRLGRRRQAPSEFVRAQVTSIQGALLGLFALLLGFTFAMALSRFDLRQQMVVREANAIGTAALRAQTLPGAERGGMLELFRSYVDVRVKTADGPNLFTPGRQELDAEANRLQEQLWAHATAVAAADPRSIPAGLSIEALNALIDVKAERDAALANHVPESVLILLWGFAFLTIGVLGFGSGLAGARSGGTVTIFAVLIAVVILVIIDLDRPRRGVIQVHQTSMVQLQESLQRVIARRVSSRGRARAGRPGHRCRARRRARRAPGPRRRAGRACGPRRSR